MHPVEDIILPDYLESDLDDVPPAYADLIGEEPDLDTSTMAWIKERGTRKWQEAVQGYLASVSFTDTMIAIAISFTRTAMRSSTTMKRTPENG